MKLDLETLKKILHVTYGHLIIENLLSIAIRQTVKLPTNEKVLAFTSLNLNENWKNDNKV